MTQKEITIEVNYDDGPTETVDAIEALVNFFGGEVEKRREGDGLVIFRIMKGKKSKP